MSWRETGFFSAIDSDRNYEVFVDRLKTFISPPPWRGPQGFWVMAEAGFVYTGEEDIVFCFSCNIELDGWSKCIDPLLRHKEESHTCSFLKRLRKHKRRDKLVTTPLGSLSTLDSASCCEPITIVNESPVTRGTSTVEYNCHHNTRLQCLKCVVGSLPAIDSSVYCAEKTDKVAGNLEKNFPFMMSNGINKMSSTNSDSVLTDTDSESTSLHLSTLFPGDSSDMVQSDMEEDDLPSDNRYMFGEECASSPSLQNYSHQRSLTSSSSQVSMYVYNMDAAMCMT